MITCCLCHTSFNYNYSLRELFQARNDWQLCYNCKKGWYTLASKELCRYCSAPLKEGKCFDCIEWIDRPIVKNISLFPYEGTFKKAYGQYKFQGDYALHQLFTNYIKKAYLRYYYKYDYVCVVPSHVEAVKERGYHHLLPFINALPVKQLHVLAKTNKTTQHKQNRKKRLKAEGIFEYIGQQLPKRVLLFDDIYTTGASIHYCAKLLKRNGATEVSSLTIGRTLQQFDPEKKAP